MRTINRSVCLFLLACICGLTVNAQENQTYILHTIEKGQSLYSIASMYGVSQADIVKMNPGSDEKIYIGHTLRIPRNTTGSQKETFHTIEAGETLYRLTVKYNVSAKAICDANPGLSAENFRIGQVIRIPAPDETPVVSDIDNSSKTADVTSEIPAAVQSRCRDMHKVKRKETIYSISKEYGITEAELIEANPELKGKNKIKKGSFLCIPYPTTTANTGNAKPQTIPTNNELFSENKKEAERISTIKAAVILPFLPDAASRSESARMVEYYEGFLMAVDSLKRSGTSIDLYTYNSGANVNSLNDILSKNEMKNMDIIFGPLQQQQIKPLADFAKKNDIRLVIPFTSKDNTVFRNPAIYQINTPQSYLYSEVYDHFVRQFPNANVIFIEASKTKDKADFIKGLKDELRNRSIPMATLDEDASVEALKSALKTGRENIFIPTSGSNLVLIKCLPQLTLLVRENPEFSIHMFGYPEWQTYTKDHLESFFELDTYFYSSFYTNDLFPAAKNFTRNYRRWYGKDMDERYPKYGMLGFDTGYFFLKGLARYGSELENNLQRMDFAPIQTGFKFQRVNNWGGFVNKKVFFVRFTKNYELVKLDFD